MDPLRSRTELAWRQLRPDIDTSPMTVVGQINRITAALRAAIEPIYQQAGVSGTEVQILVPLRYSTESVTAIRVAEQLGMSRAGVAKALASMDQRGLIVRRPNAEDRRSATIHLTDTGEAVIDDVFPEELRIHEELLASLGGQRPLVESALRLLADAVDPVNAPSPSRPKTEEAHESSAADVADMI